MVSETQKQQYLKRVAETGLLVRAAEGIASYSTFKDLREKDPEFQAAVEAALEQFGDVIEREAIRRAVVGWLEPVYYRGQKVGYKRKFSDRLLEVVLKKWRPEYREHVQVDASVKGGVLAVPVVDPRKWAETFGGGTDA